MFQRLQHSLLLPAALPAPPPVPGQISTINDLPGELIAKIFAQVAAGRDGPRTLLRAAQVNRAGGDLGGKFQTKNQIYLNGLQDVVACV